MASHVLSSKINIHSVGADLAFPHHDNELAQSEAYWQKDPCSDPEAVQWVNYSMHIGHLSIAGAKMSKYLKKFVTIREALESGEWTSRKLRVLFMMVGWRGGIEMLGKMKTEVNGWQRTVNNSFVNVHFIVVSTYFA